MSSTVSRHPRMSGVLLGVALLTLLAGVVWGFARVKLVALPACGCSLVARSLGAAVSWGNRGWVCGHEALLMLGIAGIGCPTACSTLGSRLAVHNLVTSAGRSQVVLRPLKL